MRAAREVSGPVIRRTSIHAVIAGWEASGKSGSLEFVQRMLAGHDRQRALLVVARRKVLRDGAEKAFRWAEAMPDSDDEAFKLNLVRRVASAAAEIEPEAAGAWAKQHLEDSYAAGLPQRIGTRWAKRDPEAALSWLSTLPPGKDRKNGVEETFRTWMRRDKPSAKAWVRAAELEPWMDPAVSLYAQHLSGVAPEEGMVWAGKISDDELRSAAQTLVARWWLVSDAEPAQAYLDGLDRDEFSEIFWRKVYEIPGGLRSRVRQFKELEQRKEEEAS